MTPYATVDDLTTACTALGISVPTGAAGLLLRASRMVRRATVCAIYDVDDDGNATWQHVIDGLKDATVEQVLAWAETGSSGVPVGYQSVSAGRISLGRDASGGAKVGDGEQLAPQAVLALEAAHLTGHGPWSP